MTNRFIECMEKIADMFLLSLLWLIASLPVVTVIPATIALYYCAVKKIRRGVGNLVPNFLSAFKENLKQGIILDFIYLFIAAGCYMARHFALFMGLSHPLGKVYYIFYLMVIVLTAIVSAYLLPVVSRFRTDLFSALRLALSFAFGNLVTLIPLLITFAGMLVLICLFPPSLLLCPAAYAFLLSFSVEKALRKYTEDSMGDRDEIKDEWYMDQ